MPRTRWASRCRSRRGSAARPSTRNWSRRSWRSKCSTPRRSGSTAPFAWRPSDLLPFQVLLVILAALDVAARDVEQVVLVLLLELANNPPRRAEHQHAVWDLLAFGNQRVRPDERTAADLRAVHHHAVDADERAVADGAAVQHYLVSDADHAPELQRVARIDVQHGAVLDVAAGADGDLIIVRTDHDLEPHVLLCFEDHRADEGRVRRDVMVLAAQLNAPFAEGEDGHAAIIMQ